MEESPSTLAWRIQEPRAVFNIERDPRYLKAFQLLLDNAIRSCCILPLTRAHRRLGAAGFPATRFFFQPADIVTQILNFGVPAPIDVQIAGNHQLGNYNVARQLTNRIRAIPGAVGVHVQQAYDAPTLHLEVDRTFAQSVGLSQRDVADNLLVWLSSSFQTGPAFWLNPQNGINYNVAVQTPCRVGAGHGPRRRDRPVPASSLLRPLVQPTVQLQPLLQPVQVVIGSAALLAEAVLADLEHV